MITPLPQTAGATLPASWYSTRTVYELERRAIFAKHWLLTTHEHRLKNPGAYASFTIAGYPFFIIRDRQSQFNAFLNVCRHRAFPVVQKEEGQASILACKYHGWSYSLTGKLAKAPKFDTVSDFDKTQYSLFRVHLKIDKRGFIWVNLDGAEEPSIPWDQHLAAVDEQDRLKAFQMNEFSFDHAWNMDGEYNWKTLIDNYNECYHCSVAHPGIAQTTKLNSYDVNTTHGYIEHYAESKGNPDDTTGNVAPTFMFPHSSVTMTDHYFYLMRVVPVSEHKVSMQYEVYRHKDASDKDFQEIDTFFKQVEAEDKFLCTNAQKNLNAGGYVSGPLHPHNEKGVIHFKSLLKRALLDHRALEKEQRREIWPARRSPAGGDIEEEEQFCQSLCDGNQNRSVAW